MIKANRVILCRNNNVNLFVKNEFLYKTRTKAKLSIRIEVKVIIKSDLS